MLLPASGAALYAIVKSDSFSRQAKDVMDDAKTRAAEPPEDLIGLVRQTTDRSTGQNGTTQSRPAATRSEEARGAAAEYGAQAGCCQALNSRPGDEPTPYARRVEERFERQARNEALMRAVNEQIAELSGSASGWADPEHQFDFQCECGRAEGCESRVVMTKAAYERVREQRIALR